MSPNPLKAVHSSSEGVGATEALGSQDAGRELLAVFIARVSSYLSYFYFQGLFSSSHFGDALNTDETQCTQSY